MTSIGNMSLDELRQLIEEIVDERLEAFANKYLSAQEMSEKPTWNEVREYIEAHRVTPAPGTKSGLEILLDERARRAEY